MSRKRLSAASDSESEAGPSSGPSTKRARTSATSAFSTIAPRRPPSSSAEEDEMKSGSEVSMDDHEEEEEEDEPVARRNGVANGKQRASRQATGDGDDADEGADSDEDEPLEEAERSQDDIELERDIAEEIQASHRTPGNVAEMGVIEKVDVTNFMCHNRLTIRLGPQINFVIGHNGSGKSAILTAITIALGGKATSTDRGKSLKSFVKEGKAGALVELTLKNRGSEAFKPELYGKSITIERRINADGGGGWKIKSDTGRVVSTKRDELNAICDHSNIQVDNPMNVLSQDNARQFLSASHAAEKYQFFLRGTQLTQLANEYEVVKTNIAKIRSVVERKKQVLPDLETRAREATARYDTIQKRREQAEKLETYRSTYVWAQVAAKEDELEAVVSTIVKAEDKLKKQESKLAEAEANEAKENEILSALDVRINEARARDTGLKDEMDALKEQSKKAKDKQRDIMAHEGQLSSQFTRQRSTVEDLQTRIDDEATRMSDGNRAKRQALEAQQQQAIADRKALERKQVELGEELYKIERDLAGVTARERETAAGRDRLRTRVAEAQTLQDRLRSARGNRLAAYGPNIPQLMQSIEREKGWRQKPVGPIGVHLKLKDMEWAPVLESVIGNTLNAFCVTNHHDRRLLENHKRRTNNPFVSILTGSDEPFDFSHGEPPEDIATILRVLDIDNDFVMRQLVNAVHIERAALVPRRVDGDTLMRARRPNVQFAFSKDMYRISGGDQGSATQTLNPHKGPPRLSSDVTAQLAQAQEEQRQAGEELQAADAALRSIGEERRALQDAAQKIKRELPQIKKQINARVDDEARLAEDMREDEPMNVAALEEAKQEANDQMETIKRQFEEVQREKEKSIEELRPLTEKLDALKAQSREYRDTLEAGKAPMLEAIKRRLTAQTHNTHWKTEIAEQKKKIAKLQEQSTEVQEKLDEFTTSAEAFEAERPDDISHQPEWYSRQIIAIEKQLAEAERLEGQSVEDIVAEVTASSKAFMNAKTELAGFASAIKHLDAALNTRLSKWHYFRKNIALRAKGQFTYHLSNRGYTGSLDFNHEAGKLRLRVQTEDSAKQQRDKDPKSLSGGEKSFSTICLLLALWEAIGCPIRCLDEFDVFMDAVNRRISSKMIIDAAKTAQGVQYILITPQSMANLTLGNAVRVHKLADPERNQGTLQG